MAGKVFKNAVSSMQKASKSNMIKNAKAASRMSSSGGKRMAGFASSQAEKATSMARKAMHTTAKSGPLHSFAAANKRDLISKMTRATPAQAGANMGKNMQSFFTASKMPKGVGVIDDFMAQAKNIGPKQKLGEAINKGRQNFASAGGWEDMTKGVTRRALTGAAVGGVISTARGEDTMEGAAKGAIIGGSTAFAGNVMRGVSGASAGTNPFKAMHTFAKDNNMSDSVRTIMRNQGPSQLIQQHILGGR